MDGENGTSEEKFLGQGSSDIVSVADRRRKTRDDLGPHIRQRRQALLQIEVIVEGSEKEQKGQQQRFQCCQRRDRPESEMMECSLDAELASHMQKIESCQGGEGDRHRHGPDAGLDDRGGVSIECRRRSGLSK